MILTDTQALSVDFRNDAWAAPPYNGATAYRPDFDHWLADHADAAGAHAAVRHDGHRPAARLRDRRPRHRRAHRPSRRRRDRLGRDRLRRGQQLPRQGGRPLRRRRTPKNFTLGVKETLCAAEGGDRRALRGARPRGRRHRDHRLHRRRQRRRVRLHQPRHDRRRRRAQADQAGRPEARPEEIIAAMKRHSAIAPLVEGGELQGVLRPPHPRSRAVDDAEDDRRRVAHRRRRRGAVPRRRHLAGGRQLRDGQRDVRR